MRHRQELIGIQSAPQYQFRSSASCMSAATRHFQRLRRSYVSVSKSNNIFRLNKWQHQLQLSTSGFDNSDNDGMACQHSFSLVPVRRYPASATRDLRLVSAMNPSVDRDSVPATTCTAASATWQRHQLWQATSTSATCTCSSVSAFSTAAVSVRSVIQQCACWSALTLDNNARFSSNIYLGYNSATSAKHLAALLLRQLPCSFSGSNIAQRQLQAVSFSK